MTKVLLKEGRTVPFGLDRCNGRVRDRKIFLNKWSSLTPRKLRVATVPNAESCNSVTRSHDRVSVFITVIHNYCLRKPIISNLISLDYFDRTVPNGDRCNGLVVITR